MNVNDLRFIRTSIELAQKAGNNGNHPSGAILVDEKGHIVLGAENNVVTEKDCTNCFDAK